jgi:hypothetical protein
MVLANQMSGQINTPIAAGTNTLMWKNANKTAINQIRNIYGLPAVK